VAKAGVLVSGILLMSLIVGLTSLGGRRKLVKGRMKPKSKKMEKNVVRDEKIW